MFCTPCMPFIILNIKQGGESSWAIGTTFSQWVRLIRAHVRSRSPSWKAILNATDLHLLLTSTLYIWKFCVKIIAYMVPYQQPAKLPRLYGPRVCGPSVERAWQCQQWYSRWHWQRWHSNVLDKNFVTEHACRLSLNDWKHASV